MALIIRLSRRGRLNSPLYRITVCEHTAKRDGKFVEVIGTFNNQVSPALVNLKEDRAKHWILNGAVPTETVGSIIKKKIPGLLEERNKNKLSKIHAARKQRKTRLAKLTKGKKQGKNEKKVAKRASRIEFKQKAAKKAAEAKPAEKA